MNQLAREISRSPGRVSEILTALRRQGLVGADNLPIIPELFWAVAEEWKPRWTPLRSPPPPEPPERYRLTGTLGALALEVPLVAGAAGTWPRLYVADDVDLATVVGAFGSASGWTGSEVAICPSRYGFAWMSPAHQDGYPVANQLVVALDLAQDRARGREVLEGWDPKEFTVSGELRLEGPGIGNLVASLAALAESASSAEFALHRRTGGPCTPRRSTPGHRRSRYRSHSTRRHEAPIGATAKRSAGRQGRG